jgi:hypothetical protein
MNEAARINPFNTENFIWIDAGYFRAAHANKGPIVRNNITQNGVLPNQMLFHSVFGPERPWDQEIAAGAFGGRAQAIFEANEKYWMSFWYMVTKGQKVCYEQRVMVTMYRTWPDLCSIHYSGRDGDWFAMGRNWLRNPGLIFSSNGAVLGNSANETLLPTTVVEEPVIFPAAGLIMAKTVHQLKV